MRQMRIPQSILRRANARKRTITLLWEDGNISVTKFIATTVTPKNRAKFITALKQKPLLKSNYHTYYKHNKQKQIKQFYLAFRANSPCRFHHSSQLLPKSRLCVGNSTNGSGYDS
jgi:hypothetical protein